MEPKYRAVIRRIRIAIRWMLPIGLVIFFCTCQQARAIKLLAPTWFGMQRIANHVYVDKATTAPQRDEILTIVSQAHDRVGRYYGAINCQPNLFFCSTEKSFQSFGGSRQTGATFWTAASLFSPRGQSSAIVAHEWSHAELHTRIGFWNWLGVPQWFDEGLAVTVSEEPRHSESVYQQDLQAGAHPPALPELVSLRQWSRAVTKYRDPKLNPRQDAIVYATAGHEVRNWFNKAGRTGLQKFCAAIDAGTNFTAAYSNAMVR